jgi:ribonuclease HII
VRPRWGTEPWVAGVDEAGRGPLAGPVVAAAVILDPGRRIRGLNDSKLLAPEVRERLAARIRQAALAVGLGWADVAEIDALNILEATHLAMRRALLALPIAPRHVRIDGNRAPRLADLPFCATLETLVGGDGRDAAIAAASILAKTWRDAFMVRAAERHPGYAFAAHKGYCTADHLAALAMQGPCPMHRRSFEPVRAASGGYVRRRAGLRSPP